MQYAYSCFNSDDTGKIKYDEDEQCIIWNSSFLGKNLVIGLQEAVERVYISKEAKASAVVTLQRVLRDLEDEKIEIKGKGFMETYYLLSKK